MSAGAERALYETDHAAWVRYSAPRIAARLAVVREIDLAFAWSLLVRETQVAVWEHLDDAQRTKLKAVRA